MGLTLKVAPSVEPVTLAEAKLHCKVDGTDDDALITALIVAARQQAEHRTGRALVTQQWELTQSVFPLALYAYRIAQNDPRRIELPKPILQSVQSVKYLDDNGVQQTLANTEYQVVTSELVGYVQPAYGKSWPSCRVQPDSVVIAYTCGYGDAAAVPISIKSWIKMAVATMYAQREAIITGTIVAEVPRDFFAGLLDPFLVPGL
jgi:uncharacterized phiE125 gp8 family phage protein